MFDAFIIFQSGFQCNRKQKLLSKCKTSQKALLWKALDYYKYLTNCYYHTHNFVSPCYPILYPCFTMFISAQ